MGFVMSRTVLQVLVLVSLSTPMSHPQVAHAQFAGSWTDRPTSPPSSKRSSSELRLIVQQKDSGIQGRIVSTMQSGNRITAGTFTGVVDANHSTIHWVTDSEDNPAKGTALLTLEHGKMHWVLGDSSTEVWLPLETTLVNK